MLKNIEKHRLVVARCLKFLSIFQLIKDMKSLIFFKYINVVSLNFDFKILSEIRSFRVLSFLSLNK